MKQAAVLVPILVALTVGLGAQTAPAAGTPDAAPPPPTTAPGSSARKSMVIDKVIVRVNGEILTQAELVRKQIDALRNQKIQVDNPQALQDDATLAKLLADVTPGVLVDSVDELPARSARARTGHQILRRQLQGSRRRPSRRTTTGTTSSWSRR